MMLRVANGDRLPGSDAQRCRACGRLRRRRLGRLDQHLRREAAGLSPPAPPDARDRGESPGPCCAARWRGGALDGPPR